MRDREDVADKLRNGFRPGNPGGGGTGDQAGKHAKFAQDSGCSGRNVFEQYVDADVSRGLRHRRQCEKNHQAKRIGREGMRPVGWRVKKIARHHLVTKSCGNKSQAKDGGPERGPGQAVMRTF